MGENPGRGAETFHMRKMVQEGKKFLLLEKVPRSKGMRSHPVPGQSEHGNRVCATSKTRRTTISQHLSQPISSGINPIDLILFASCRGKNLASRSTIRGHFFEWEGNVFRGMDVFRRDLGGQKKLSKGLESRGAAPRHRGRATPAKSFFASYLEVGELHLDFY